MRSHSLPAGRTGAKMSTAETSEDPDQTGRDGPARIFRIAPASARDNPANDDTVTPGPGGGPPDRLFTPPYVRLLGMQAAYGFSFSMFFLLPKYLATAGAPASQIGFVMAGFGIACILTIPFLPGIVGALGRRGALIAATLSLAAAGAAFAVIQPTGWARSSCARRKA